MSSFNLREFNNLSRNHDYFMINSRENGFPTLEEHSLILQNIIENHDSNSTDKIYNFKTVKPKKYVKFIIPYNPSFNTISKSQIYNQQLYSHNNIIAKVPLNSNRYHRKNNIRHISYNIDKQNIINPYKNNYIIKVNKNLNRPKYYKISDHIKKIITSPEISHYAFSNSNINDSDNEIHTLSFKGNRIFTNSFFGLNSDSKIVSPEKNNISNSNITKGIELFRDYDELKKKKEEIIQRKMKKNLSPKIEESLKKEKDKDLKEKKINIKLHKFEPKNENKLKLIPFIKDKYGILNLKKIKPRFNSNDNNPNSKQNNINYTNNNSNRIIINKPLQNNTNKINININNNANNSNNSTFSKGINQSDIIKVSNSITDLKNNNNIIYTKKNYKKNNIFISKYCSPQRITVNNKIKKISETIRKKYENSENKDKEQRPYNIKTYSPYPPDIFTNPNRFIIPSKKYVEDYSSRTPTFLYSDDKKVCIKVHIISNLEEKFLGRKKTKEKMKMQRVISIYFINKNVSDKGLNLIRNKIKKNSKDLNNNALSAIKEEEEKSKVEPEILMKKDESQIDKKINTKLKYKPEPEPLSENISKIEKKEEKIKINKNKDKNEEKNKRNINEISNKNECENEIKEKLSPNNNDYELKNNKIKDNNKKEEKKLDYVTEILKTEPKVETKRFFRRRFDISNKKPEIKDEIKEKEEKNEEKEQNKNQSQIKEKSYRRIFERNKNTLKQDELNNNTDQKIEIKGRHNNNRKYEIFNKQFELELFSSNSKSDIKRGYFLNKNFDKKEEKYIDEYENKFMKTEPIQVIDQKPNFRANFRRRFDKSKNENISKNDIGKDEPKAEEKENFKNFRRRFGKSKIESESHLIKNENKNDIKEKDNKNVDNTIRRRFQYSNPGNGNNIESIKKEENIETNEIKTNEKKYRRRFQKDAPKHEPEIKTEINDEQKEKKNYEKGNQRRFGNQNKSENNSQLIKDEKKTGMNERQNTESNFRKRYVRHFGNKK